MEVEVEHVPSSKLFRQGAEARVFESSFMVRRAVVKERFSKYRHPVLDAKFTSNRLIGEARNVVKARRLGVATPALFALDPGERDATVSSGSVADGFSSNAASDGKVEDVAQQIGKAIAELHDGGADRSWLEFDVSISRR